MYSYKNTSHKSISEGLRSLSGYQNTTWIIAGGEGVSYWTDELKKIIADPAWRQYLQWDPVQQTLRFGPEIELIIFDDGNELLKGEKWQKKQLDGMPGLEYSGTKQAYGDFFTVCRGFQTCLYHPPTTAARLGQSVRLDTIRMDLMQWAASCGLTTFPS